MGLFLFLCIHKPYRFFPSLLPLRLMPALLLSSHQIDVLPVLYPHFQCCSASSDLFYQTARNKNVQTQELQ